MFRVFDSCIFCIYYLFFRLAFIHLDLAMVLFGVLHLDPWDLSRLGCIVVM